MRVHSLIRFTALALVPALTGTASAQLNDQTQAPNTFGAGILRSLDQQIGMGRGSVNTPTSSRFIIARDPFRSIRRGRQLFQRKFQMEQGLGPRTNDGVGDIENDGSLGAGLTDSCAACHSVPFGAAGAGGNVFTRPDSRDAPHLFGLGLVEMLADEITKELREIRTQASDAAQNSGSSMTVQLLAKGISYGTLTAHPDGSFDNSNIEGVNDDLRVRPFFAEGSTISIREFAVGAFNAEMGLEAPDPDLRSAATGMDVTTPSGMELTGSLDAIEAPPANGPMHDPDGDGFVNEIHPALVDHMEFYLLNYFKPGIGRQTVETDIGRRIFDLIGCTQCHVPNLTIDHDRRVADVETVYDTQNSNRIFSWLAATATPLFNAVPDPATPFPDFKVPAGGAFVVENIYADFKRHDLGPDFHENNFDGTVQTEFITEPLWGVASTPPYGHDGRSMTLRSVIHRHGGEATVARDAFANLSEFRQDLVLDFLGTLQLFSPEDTPSNLDPRDPANPDYPLHGHGSISLGPLFNNPNVGE